MVKSEKNRIPYYNLVRSNIVIRDPETEISTIVYLDIDESIVLKAVSRVGKALQYVQENKRTPELCEAAIRQDGMAIYFVPNQTLELCLLAIKQNPNALQYITNQTPELCKIAVRCNPMTIKYVRNQTPELAMMAVKQNIYAYEYIENPTTELSEYVKERRVRSSIESGIQSFKDNENSDYDVMAIYLDYASTLADREYVNNMYTTYYQNQ